MASTINASTSPAAIIQTADGTGILALQTAGTTAVTINASQNVGIGTASPSYKLDVQGSVGSTIASKTAEFNAAGGSIYSSYNDATKTWRVGAGIQSAGLFSIHNQTDGITGMSIDSSGNVLVGTTSLTEGERASFARSNTTTSATVIAAKNTGATSTVKNTNSIVRFASGASNADVNIHLTDVTANDYVVGGNNGGLYCMSNSQGVRLASGGTSWASDSDERLKENLIPISNALNKVNTLRAVIGNYIDDEDKRSRAFLIAQDVQAVLPEAIDATDPEKLGLQYTDVIPLLVAAIKEQQALITSLTARITALEGA